MSSKIKLRFKLGEESFPTILAGDKQIESPFARVIHQAEIRLKDITTQLIGINTNSKSAASDSEIWKNSTPNNIIAFLGDRGSGKTSCMRTVVMDCREKHPDWMFAEEIDPSFFDKDHNVLEILIGSLYGEFKKARKDWQKKRVIEQNELRDMQESFKTLKATLRYLKKENTSDKDEEYEIDALDHLNAGGKIRILMKNLIDCLLKIYGKKMLVVSIDDLDLNIEQSYEMMEHIRKYLIIPNVIIITAAKFGQLFDSICLNLTGIYKDIPHRVSDRDIAEMTERYLNKLLPLDQRFEMPMTESYMDASIDVLDEDDNTVYSAETILLGLPSLIFEKTRYLFYNSSGMLSLVIPRNLRALRMLVSMMVKMNPYGEQSQSQNKQIFKEYFFNEWLGIIDPQYRSFAKSLLEEENLAKINHLVVKKLYDFFLSKAETYAQIKEDVERAEKTALDSSFIRRRQLLRDILNPSNSFWNVSIGDVVTVINAVKRTNDSADALFLLFFIESFYSIKLYETYDRLTEMTDKNGLQLPADTTTTAPELKTSVRGDVPEYFRLVGGAFFSLSGDSFISLSRNRQKNEFREISMINGKILLDEIRSLEKAYVQLFNNQSDDKKLDIPKALSARLRLCEFFMLTVKNRIDLKTSDTNARLLNEPVYFKDFGATAKNMVFDVTMPFFNAIYPERAYGRFGKVIFEIANIDPDSLLNRMTNLKRRGKGNDTWELMSKAAIRNMEILEDITEWLQDRKVTGSNDAAAMIRFYSQFDFKESKDPIPVGKYAVKTYGKSYEKGIKKDKKSFYYIDYAVFAELGKVIADLGYMGDDPELKEIARDNKYLYISIFNRNALFPQKDTYTQGEIFDALAPYCGRISVDMYFKEGSEELISDKETARCLAELRLEHMYEFNGKLPGGVQFFYSNFLDTLYKQRKNELIDKKTKVEEEINYLKEEHIRINEAIKADSKEMIQNNTEAKKLQTNAFKQQAKTYELEKNLQFFRNRLDNETDKTELKRLRKEEEKLIKELNANNAASQADMNQLQLLLSLASKEKNSIQTYSEETKANKEKTKEKQNELRRIDADLAELEFFMANPIEID